MAYNLYKESGLAVPVTPLSIFGTHIMWGVPATIKVNVGRPLFVKDYWTGEEVSTVEAFRAALAADRHGPVPREPGLVGRRLAKEGPMALEGLFIARGEKDLFLLPRMANRHGLVAGATGTGKTVTLQVMAENFSRIGVPVFMADVKGDLAGVSQPGTASPKIQERLGLLKLGDHRLRREPGRPSGTSSASRATPCGRPSPTWGRSCSRACSTSTMSRAAS